MPGLGFREPLSTEGAPLPTSERTHLIRRVSDTWGRGRALERGSRGPRKAASRLTREHNPQAQPRATCPRPLLRPLAQLSPSRACDPVTDPEPPPPPASSRAGRKAEPRPAGNGAEGRAPTRPRRCQLPSPPRPARRAHSRGSSVTAARALRWAVRNPALGFVETGEAAPAAGGSPLLPCPRVRPSAHARTRRKPPPTQGLPQKAQAWINPGLHRLLI